MKLIPFYYYSHVIFSSEQPLELAMINFATISAEN